MLQMHDFWGWSPGSVMTRHSKDICCMHGLGVYHLSSGLPTGDPPSAFPFSVPAQPLDCLLVLLAVVVRGWITLWFGPCRRLQ